MNRRSLFVAATLFALVSAPFSLRADSLHEKGATPAHISRGEEVSLKDYLVPGKTTVFDFTSEYCPPCRAIAPRLAKAHAAKNDLAVVSIDINRPGIKGIDWKSPVAAQYKLDSIPHFEIYGPTGALLAKGDDARKMVEDLIQ